MIFSGKHKVKKRKTITARESKKLASFKYCELTQFNHWSKIG